MRHLPLIVLLLSTLTGCGVETASSAAAAASAKAKEAEEARAALERVRTQLDAAREAPTARRE